MTHTPRRDNHNFCVLHNPTEISNFAVEIIKTKYFLYMNITTKSLLAVMLLIDCSSTLMAQEESTSDNRPTFSLEYTHELVTDFRNTSSYNMLQLRAALPLSSKFKADISTISTARANNFLPDNILQDFSNINTEDTPLALAVAGITWSINDNHSLFAGIRRLDEDYFCSDVLALYAHSSCGVFPTVSANAPVATYPDAALGLHYAYSKDAITLQASLYNGVGNHKFTGANNVFRICPKDDGLLFLGQAEYQHNDNHYYLGTHLYHGNKTNIDEEDTGRRLTGSIWAYTEQQLSSNTSLIAAYSRALDSNAPCTDFLALGAQYALPRATLGLFTDYARHLSLTEETDQHYVGEWATELTCEFSVHQHVSIQPSLHYFLGDGDSNIFGSLRLKVTL